MSLEDDSVGSTRWELILDPCVRVHLVLPSCACYMHIIRSVAVLSSLFTKLEHTCRSRGIEHELTRILRAFMRPHTAGTWQPAVSVARMGCDVTESVTLGDRDRGVMVPR